MANKVRYLLKKIYIHLYYFYEIPCQVTHIRRKSFFYIKIGDHLQFLGILRVAQLLF